MAGADPDQPGSDVWLPLRQGEGALVEALELLARIQIARDLDFAGRLAALSRGLPPGTLFWLVTPRETPELAALCTRLVRSGWQALLFLLAPDQTGGRRPGGYRAYAVAQAAGEVVVG